MFYKGIDLGIITEGKKLCVGYISKDLYLHPNIRIDGKLEFFPIGWTLGRILTHDIGKAIRWNPGLKQFSVENDEQFKKRLEKS